MSTAPDCEPRSTAGLLAQVRDEVASRRDSEVREAQHIVAWAELNTVRAPEDAATISDGFVDTGVPIAGEGAPLVSEFALMELCAVLGRPTTGGREYVGKILETAHRLPSVWECVTAGRVPVWRALKIADTTRLLPADAATFVDGQLAAFAATCTFAQVDRLVEEALARFDPQAAEERHREAAEGRRFDVHTDDAGLQGTIAVDGELDLADALDLDAAVGQRAEELARLGSGESRDVRRARAVGELARTDQTLDLPAEPGAGGFEAQATGGLRTSTTDDDARTPTTENDATVVEVRGAPATSLETTASGPFRRRPGRKVELHVHLTDTALTGGESVGRLGNTRSGDRHKRQVRLRDPHCAFPHCNRKAERCDLDHAHPHGQGGATCACNLVPLCRGHHRAKTHSRWAYTALDPGQYLWTSPHGHQFLVDHRGTRNLDQLDHRDPHRR